MRGDRDDKKQLPGQELELEIDGFGSQAQGVGRWQGMAVFVEGALPGELVRARLTRRRKNYAQAQLLQVLRPAAARLEPACSVYGSCGGCSLLHVDYQSELELKRDLVQQSLRRLAGLSLDVPLPLTSPAVQHYRNRVVLHYDDGKLGFYDAASHSLSRGGLPADCLLPQTSLLRLIEQVQQLLPAYQPQLVGLRGLCLRSNSSQTELLLSFICDAPLPTLLPLAEQLRQREPRLLSVWQNSGAAVYSVYGADWQLLSGGEKLPDSIGDIKLELSPASFCQVNSAQTPRLYQLVRDFAQPQPGQTLLDLYSGAGAIALSLAADCKQVIGVESYAPAVTDAENNARLNHINNCRFINGAAEQVLPQLAATNLTGRTVATAVLDPPRTGCAPSLLKALVELGPPRIVYVSCDPATLSRDLALLCSQGYQVQQLQPVDMFPRTYHIETVCLLSKLHAEHHIEINLNLDEMDLTASESKATYEEIKAWVLEQTGMNVSHLYIAQVKRKYSIIERENYNKPKSEESTQPQCPQDKEKAITDALKHFGMLPMEYVYDNRDL